MGAGADMERLSRWCPLHSEMGWMAYDSKDVSEVARWPWTSEEIVACRY